MPDTLTPAPSGGAAPSPTPAASTPSTPASATATPAAPASSSTPAAVQPAPASPSAPASAAPSNEPPKERWNDILDNARKKTRAEVEAEYRQKYAPYDTFERDPWGAVQNWLQQAQGHSLYGPLVKQWAQSQLAPPPRGEEPQADVPIVDAQGNDTGRRTFSDQQLRKWHQWNQAQQQSELDQRFKRLESDAEARAQRDAQIQAYQQATQQATQTLTELRAKPYFKEHEADIRQALEEHPEWGDNVYAAYVQVLTTKILPMLGQAEQQKVIDSLQSKASGATVSPAGAAPGKPQFRSFADAAKYYEAHPEEAKAMADRQR